VLNVLLEKARCVQEVVDRFIDRKLVVGTRTANMK
jgi:hypothetical protein